MKIAISLLLILAMVFSLTACGSAGQPESTSTVASATTSASAQTTPGTTLVEAATTVLAATASTRNIEQATTTSAATAAEPAATTEPQAEGSRFLVVYFSRTGEQYVVGTIEEGNTAIVAKAIIGQIEADSFEILPETDYYPYTYRELTDIAKQEQNSSARPAIKDPLPDLSGYETIFIGAPVWWGDWPMILYTFFESADLSGKKLVPFSTHEGSGLSGFDRKLAAAAPDSEVLTGLAIRGADCQNDRNGVEQKVFEWLNGLGY